MKRYLLNSLALLLFTTALPAQEKIFLFDDFKPAVFLMKHNVRTRADFNFDTRGQGVYFVQDGTVMELTNTQDIDTVYADGRKFVWKNDCLCEYVPKEYGDVFINWKFRDSFVGKEGAFGTTTQGKVEVMQVPGINSEYSADNIGLYSDKTDVWSIKNENTYFFVWQGKEYKIHRPSDLTKAFPARGKEIKKFLKSHNYTLNNADQVFNTLAYICTGAEPGFSEKDLIGYWCWNSQYNDVPSHVLCFVDENTVVFYNETSTSRVFHEVVGIEVPGFTGLFYCPMDDQTFGYTFENGTVRCTNGKIYHFTPKGNLKAEGESFYYQKFDRRNFAEVIEDPRESFGIRPKF